MPEVLTPESAMTSNAYRVEGLYLDWARQRLNVWVRNPAGVLEGFVYTDAPAVTMMRNLNKADLRGNSLHKRILQRLQADGKLPAGKIEGAPD